MPMSVSAPAERILQVTDGGVVLGGRPILLVAHEMGPLEPLISRTVVMRDGRVAYDGPPLESFQDVPHAHAHHPGQHPVHVDYSPDITTPLDRTGDREVGLP